jgi:ribonucleoside-diphosphate reductase alpha chain
MLETTSPHLPSSRQSLTEQTPASRPTAKASRPKSSPQEKPQTKGLEFKPFFHTETGSPFDHVEWDRRTAEINDDHGKAIFKQENVEVPASWSALATKIAVSKYFYGDISNGTEPDKGGRESSIRQLIHRVTRTITDFGKADGYFADEDSAEAFYNDLTWLCLHQHGAFNSPVWFNVGLHQEYGIGKDSGLGNYYFDEKAGEAQRAPSQYAYPQASACFIQSVDDNMESILDLAKSEAMLSTAVAPGVISPASARLARNSAVGASPADPFPSSRSTIRWPAWLKVAAKRAVPPK